MTYHLPMCQSSVRLPDRNDNVPVHNWRNAGYHYRSLCSAQFHVLLQDYVVDDKFQGMQSDLKTRLGSAISHYEGLHAESVLFCAEAIPKLCLAIEGCLQSQQAINAIE